MDFIYCTHRFPSPRSLQNSGTFPSHFFQTPSQIPLPWPDPSLERGRWRSLQGVLQPLRDHFTTGILLKIHRNVFCDFLLILLSWLQEPKEKQDLPQKRGRLWGSDRARIFLNKPFKVPSMSLGLCSSEATRDLGTQHQPQIMPIKLRRDSWTEGSLSGKAAGHRNPEPTTHPAHVHPGWEAADVLHATKGTFHS